MQKEAGQKQSEMEALNALAQQIVEDAHVSARVSARVTQLTTRYHALLIRTQVRKGHQVLCSWIHLQIVTQTPN